MWQLQACAWSCTVTYMCSMSAWASPPHLCSPPAIFYYIILQTQWDMAKCMLYTTNNYNIILILIN